MSDTAVAAEKPGLRWKVILQIALAFAVLWLLAWMAVPYISYWGVGIVGTLSLIAAGFGIYIWRLSRKSSDIVNILQQATDAKTRHAALQQLEARGNKDKDALNALARAQLVASQHPGQAISILEGVDIAKAPAVVQDDIRANLALLYLTQNRVRDALPLAEALRLGRQPQAKAKAMYAAVIAESYARSGKADEAETLLQTYPHTDPEYGEISTFLLRAQVYTFSAIRKRGRAKQAMQQLAKLNPMMLAPFTQKGVHPELVGMARQILSKQGALPKPKYRMRM